MKRGGGADRRVTLVLKKVPLGVALKYVASLGELEMKIEPYESDTFVEEMDETWRGLKPLYEQLHAYVRHKLAKK